MIRHTIRMQINKDITGIYFLLALLLTFINLIRHTIRMQMDKDITGIDNIVTSNMVIDHLFKK